MSCSAWALPMRGPLVSPPLACREYLKEASRCTIQAAADVRVQNPWAGAVLAQRDMDGFNRIHCAAPWSASIGVRFKACLPFWCQGRLDDGLHHPVLSGQYAQGSLLAVVFGDIDPSDRFGLVPLGSGPLETISTGLLGCRTPLHRRLRCVCPGFPGEYVGWPGACWTWLDPAVSGGF